MGRKSVSTAPDELRLIDGMKTKNQSVLKLKKKKVSKKNKLAWRKHTDVADVEAYLDEKRQEERIGKSSGDIFVVDTEATAPAPVGRRSTKREKKPLRCEAALLPTVDEKPKPRKQHKSAAVVRKMRARGVAMDEADPQSKEESQKTASKKKNPWARPAPKADEQEIFDLLTGQAPVKRPPRKKVSEIPAVEVAHPGASYNPSFDDHQAILEFATGVEERKLRAVARTEKFFAGIPEMDHVERERVWMKEMSAGLDIEEGEGSDEEEDDVSDSELRGDQAAPAAPKLVRAEFRKTKQQRRKEALRRLQAAEARDAKRAALREQEVFRIRSLKKDINATKQKVEEKQQKRAEKATKELATPRKLGPHRYRAPDVEVQLCDELAGSLRKLKPEGSTLQDRFASLQRRNVLEPRKKVVPHRGHRPRMYTKNPYKDGKEDTAPPKRVPKPKAAKK